MVHIRSAQNEDVSRIVDIQQESWRMTYPNASLGVTLEHITNLPWQQKHMEWQHMIRARDYDVFVAELDSVIVGFGALERGRKSQVHSLYISAESQRQRLGSKLLGRMLQGVDDVWLHVAAYNQTAITFYQRHGFVPSGARGSYSLGGGRRIPTLQLRRQLREVASKSEESLEYLGHEQYVFRGELAQQSGVRESTIKWYIEAGLLEYEQSEAGRRRELPLAKSLERIKEIQQLKAEGFRLDEIRNQLKD